MVFELRVDDGGARTLEQLLHGFAGPCVELQALDEGVLDAEAAVHATACCADEDSVVYGRPGRLLE